MQPSLPQSPATGRDVLGPGVSPQNRYAALAAGHKSKHYVVTNRAAVTNWSESQIAPSQLPWTTVRPDPHRQRQANTRSHVQKDPPQSQWLSRLWAVLVSVEWRLSYMARTVMLLGMCIPAELHDRSTLRSNISRQVTSRYLLPVETT